MPNSSTTYVSFKPNAPSGLVVFPTESKPNEQPFSHILTERCVSWRVTHDDEHENIVVSSGAKLSKFNGSITVTIGDASPDGEKEYGGKLLRGLLGYFDAFENYKMKLHVSKSAFEWLAKNALEGRFPKVQVCLDVPGFAETAGGSGLVWDTELRPYVNIVWFNFIYVIGPAIPT